MNQDTQKQKLQSTLALTPEGIIVWPRLFESESYFGTETEYYSCVLLFERDADFSDMRSAMQAAAEKKWPGQAADFYKELKKPLRNGLSKAVTRTGETDPNSFFFNRYFMNVKTQFAPPVVDIFNEKITDPGQIYGGCFVRALLSFFGYDRLGNKGISCSLSALIKIRDGAAIGGGKVDTAVAFASIIQKKPSFADGSLNIEDIETDDIPY